MNDLTIETQIQNEYIRQRRRVHPGYQPLDRHDVAWQKAADIVRSLNADPVAYVEAQFNFSRSAFPYPSELHSKIATDKYSKYMETYCPEPELIHRQQGSYIIALIDNKAYASLDDIALDENLTLIKPYIRLLICSEQALTQVLEKFKDLARRELSFNSRLHQFLKDDKTYDTRLRSVFPEGISGGTRHSCDSLPQASSVSLRW